MICHEHDCAPEIARLLAEVHRLTARLFDVDAENTTLRARLDTASRAASDMPDEGARIREVVAGQRVSAAYTLDLYECAACSAKAGSPSLCGDCLERRAAAGSRWLGQRPRKPPVAIKAAPTCLDPGGPRCLDYCACGDGAGPNAPANPPEPPDSSLRSPQPQAAEPGVSPAEAASPPVATAGVTSAGVSLPPHGPARWLLPSDARHPGHAAWVRERSC
jgi:hypothetical protein